ncbi:MAG: hypothetical protein IJM63_02260, partial [Solobacterium sp.]|nr:hypothetical protein [Solobacterium sp.]
LLSSTVLKYFLISSQPQPVLPGCSLAQRVLLNSFFPFIASTFSTIFSPFFSHTSFDRLLCFQLFSIRVFLTI